MLDSEIAELCRAEPDFALNGLEAAVWARVDRRLRERMAIKLQTLMVGAAMVGSAAIGVAAVPARSGREPMQISAVVAELAPSTLLGLPR